MSHEGPISMANVEIAWKLVNHYCEEAALQCNVEEEAVEVRRYANQEYTSHSIVPWIKAHVDWELPSQVMEMCATRKKVLHGIFPEIRRAWTLRDKTLLLWRFDKRDGQVWEHRSEEQPIGVVGLVKPRPGFVEDAQYLLVLATPVELLLFGVCCSKDGQDPLTQISLRKLVDYTTSSDGVTMICMACTDKGRVFLAGDNGHIYELLYIIGSPCRIVCCTPFSVTRLFMRFTYQALVEMVVDNERNILYACTHTKRMALEAYFLGMNGESPIQKVGGVYDKDSKASIVCISPLSKLESKWSHAHLVAVFSDGCRMYFSTSSSGNLGPDCLRLVTAKHRPPTGNKNEILMVKVNIAYCPVGGTLYLSRQLLLCDSFSHCTIVGKDSSLDAQVGRSPTLREVCFTTRLKGRLLFVADVLPTPDNALTMMSLYSQVLGESFEKTCGILRGRGDLLTQYILPKMKILVFSTMRVMEMVSVGLSIC